METKLRTADPGHLRRMLFRHVIVIWVLCSLIGGSLWLHDQATTPPPNPRLPPFMQPRSSYAGVYSALVNGCLGAFFGVLGSLWGQRKQLRTLKDLAGRDGLEPASFLWSCGITAGMRKGRKRLVYDEEHSLCLAPIPTRKQKHEPEQVERWPLTAIQCVTVRPRKGLLELATLSTQRVAIELRDPDAEDLVLRAPDPEGLCAAIDARLPS